MNAVQGVERGLIYIQEHLYARNLIRQPGTHQRADHPSADSYKRKVHQTRQDRKRQQPPETATTLLGQVDQQTKQKINRFAALAKPCAETGW